MPRSFYPNAVKEPVEVDVRSFGLRAPICTKDNPTYGIVGLFHVLPPALAWLWRLVSPRGFNNPSIVNTKGMSSEGVGSYWPFATGKRVTQANLLMEQIINTPETPFILIPNQHIGAYKTSFAPQWLTREYLSRRGNARFSEDRIQPARCSLLGYALKNLKVDGIQIPHGLLRVEEQPEVGYEAYDKGAEMLNNFFNEQIEQYLTDELHPVGRQIIEAQLRGASIEEFEQIIPMK